MNNRALESGLFALVIVTLIMSALIGWGAFDKGYTSGRCQGYCEGKGYSMGLSDVKCIDTTYVACKTRTSTTFTVFPVGK